MECKLVLVAAVDGFTVWPRYTTIRVNHTIHSDVSKLIIVLVALFITLQTKHHPTTILARLFPQVNIEQICNRHVRLAISMRTLPPHPSIPPATTLPVCRIPFNTQTQLNQPGSCFWHCAFLYMGRHRVIESSDVLYTHPPTRIFNPSCILRCFPTHF